jgi:hypothetical protein
MLWRVFCCDSFLLVRISWARFTKLQADAWQKVDDDVDAAVIVLETAADTIPETPLANRLDQVQDLDRRLLTSAVKGPRMRFGHKSSCNANFKRLVADYGVS